MDRTDVSLLFEHLYWVRDRILDAAAAAPDAYTQAEPVTIRDLRATLVHELDVEWSWRERLRGEHADVWGPEAELRPVDYPDLGSIAEHWHRDEVEMRAWIGAMSDADLLGPCRAEGTGDTHPLWYHLAHLYTHGLQQLSDAAVVLTRAGHSPGEIDFLEFIQHRSA